jgi:hypothetical protein
MKFPMSPLLYLLLLPLSLALGPSYFYITKPAKGDQWTQGDAHATTWVHAVDGIDVVDVELGRTSTSGLLLGAREVPTRWGSLNLLLGDVPPGDDYYFIFMNVTHGLVYSVSEQFTILAASSSSSNSSSEIAPDPSKPTVTISGAPGPTMSFAATYGPQAAGALPLWGGLAAGQTTITLLSAVITSLLAGFWLVI